MALLKGREIVFKAFLSGMFWRIYKYKINTNILKE